SGGFGMACNLLIPFRMNREYKLPDFDAGDFIHRWSKARIASIRDLFPADEPAPHADPENDPQGEAGWVEKFFTGTESMEPESREKRKDALFRGVFENTRKLALSLSRKLGLTFEVEDFQGLLGACGIPCVQGEWDTRPNARVLCRKGCAFGEKAGSQACDYWREALDGLVMGLGDRERLARHASVRHGDESCIDVFFTDTGNLRDGSLAWGPVPEHMALELFETAEFFRHETGITVDLTGFREGDL